MNASGRSEAARPNVHPARSIVLRAVEPTRAERLWLRELDDIALVDLIRGLISVERAVDAHRRAA